MLKRHKECKCDWERPYLEGNKNLIFRNTFGDLRTVPTELSANNVRSEFERYDTAHRSTLAHVIERRLVKVPFLVQTVFGILGGIGKHPDDVMHMNLTANRQ